VVWADPSGVKKEGYSNLFGVGISDQAVSYCCKQGIDVEKITDIASYG